MLYFWGYSFELIHESMWTSFEETIRFITEDPASVWVDVADLFHPPHNT